MSRLSPPATASRRTMVAALGLALCGGWARADKPDGTGGGRGREAKGRGEPQGQPPREARPPREPTRAAPESGVAFRFTPEHRRIAGEYYVAEAGRGHCPPGLARKGKGCLPPGQARKWQRGMPLPRDLRVYEVPVELRVRLPAPPAHHRYVQIAGDILLIAIGTGIVVDALENLLR